MNPAKLHSSLSMSLRAKSLSETAMPIIVRVRPGPIARGELGALSTLKSGHSFKLIDAMSLSATPSEIAALTDDPTVDLIWPDLPVHTWLDDALPLIKAAKVWESGFTGRGVKLAILDTGLDGEHPDFAGRLAAYRDFVDPAGRDADKPRDPNGHGTHVAGIAAGSGAHSSGRWRGVAPEASLIIARVLDAAGNGSTSVVMAGIEWAVENGAQVLNISLGGPPFPSDGTDALSALCNAVVDRGVVVCAAAGNLGPAGHTVGSPGAAAKAITVGACEGDARLSEESVARFSSRGPTADGRAKPDLLFPGVGIVAPRAAGTALGSPINERYTSLSGTSQATPIATGTAALLLQANPRANPAEIKHRMVQGAHALANAEASAQGAGRGDAYNAFIAQAGAPLESPPPAAPGQGGRSERNQPSGCLPTAATGFLKR